MIVVFSLGMMAFTIVSVTTFDRADRSLFGYSAFIVLSDSMKATDFDAGDLVLIKKTDPSKLKAGDIISFQSPDESNYGEIVTHKIRKVTKDSDGNPGFVTYGTTTDSNDQGIVTYNLVIGKYQGHIPNVGTFFQFLKTVPGYFICIFTPFFILILVQARNSIKLFRKYKKEQVEEIQQEKKELEEERLKSQQMMEQLARMQQQMQQSGMEIPQMPGQPAMQPQTAQMQQVSQVQVNTPAEGVQPQAAQERHQIQPDTAHQQIQTGSSVHVQPHQDAALQVHTKPAQQTVRQPQQHAQNVQHGIDTAAAQKMMQQQAPQMRQKAAQQQRQARQTAGEVKQQPAHIRQEAAPQQAKAKQANMTQPAHQQPKQDVKVQRTVQPAQPSGQTQQRTQRVRQQRLQQQQTAPKQSNAAQHSGSQPQTAQNRIPQQAAGKTTAAPQRVRSQKQPQQPAQSRTRITVDVRAITGEDKDC